ncbi:hypothetical protein [Luethyella okanaganae]|uniref:DUF1345 domain-containing protein n=1 Tax=Luethyella okanaganae TaxID=69372 RepID=A0ABW1VCW5_9MICO
MDDPHAPGSDHDTSQAQASPDQERRAETRWPALTGLVVALALYALVSNPGTAALRYLAIALVLLILLPLFVLNPHRLSRETQWSRWMSIVLTSLLVVANQINVLSVIGELLSGTANGPRVLLTALQVWVTNVIAFGLLYWDLDRGGPVARGTLSRDQLPPADFAFPQDDHRDAVVEVTRQSSQRGDWRPGFVDYLYVSLTNMMAFSPTDAMPLRTRTKMFMAVQALTGFILLALVISRAVNILG